MSYGFCTLPGLIAALFRPPRQRIGSIREAWESAGPSSASAVQAPGHVVAQFPCVVEDLVVLDGQNELVEQGHALGDPAAVGASTVELMSRTFWRSRRRRRTRGASSFARARTRAGRLRFPGAGSSSPWRYVTQGRARRAGSRSLLHRLREQRARLQHLRLRRLDFLISAFDDCVTEEKVDIGVGGADLGRPCEGRLRSFPAPELRVISSERDRRTTSPSRSGRPLRS